LQTCKFAKVCKSFCKLLLTFGAFILFYFILRVKQALANKMLRFQKSKMAAASIWKIEKK